MYFSQSIVRLCQTYKNPLEKVGHTISISNYKPLSGSSYIKLPNELDHPKKV